MTPNLPRRHFEPKPVRPPFKPLPRPALDWAAFSRERGLGVTICLAAKTLNGPIVTVSDRRIAWGDTGTPSDDNGTLKTELISPTWGAMFAAGDLRPVSGLLADIRRRLDPTKDRQTVALVRAAVESAYRALFEERFVAERLSRYGFDSMAHFRRDGLAVFGPELLEKFSKEIDEFNIGIDLLVYGFDVGPRYGKSHIFTVLNPGVFHDCDVLGWGIIGSGEEAARSTLLRKPFTDPDLFSAVWRLFDAKFSAEAAFAVGKSTSAVILREDGTPDMMAPVRISDIRKVWETEQKSGPPPAAKDAIKAGLTGLFRAMGDETT